MATQRFAELTDLTRLGIAVAAFASLTDAEKLGALDAASSIAAGLIGNAYKLPLVSWEDDLRRWVVSIATYDLLARRGFPPGADNSDAHVRLRYEDANKALREIGAGRARLLNAVDSSTTTYEGGAYIVSQPKRGW